MDPPVYRNSHNGRAPDLMEEGPGKPCDECNSAREMVLQHLAEDLGEVLGKPRFPLKGSFKGDVDIGIDRDVDIELDHRET